MTKESLLELMEAFVRGNDRSLDLAGKIEVGLEDLFNDQAPFSDLSLALASYRPGGGPYLYDEEQISSMMKRVVSEMRAAQHDGSEIK
jgi:hypothetical protein